MSTTPSSTSASQTLDASQWLTPATLVAIAVFAVLVILAIIWGARLKAQRSSAEVELRDAGTTVTADTPIEDAAPAEPPAIETPPVAPAPPPLAGDDTPVVATAPYDVAPATYAADLATPPAPPEQASAGTDDLTRLKGVGPKLAARLGELGVTSFAQVAALSPADADALDAQLGMFKGRLHRDRWIEQAAYLADGDRAGFEAAFGRL